MTTSREDLTERFRGLEDQELIRRAASGNLTELAQEVALAETQARGLHLPETSSPDSGFQAIHENGDFVVVARYSTPTEAHVLQALLESEDIPTIVPPGLVDALPYLSTSQGGVRVEVPETHLAKARHIVEAFTRGDYSLDEDSEIGSP